MSTSDAPSAFLSRWSRLKRQSRQEEIPETLDAPEPQEEAQTPAAIAEAAEPAPTEDSAPPPSLEDVDALTFQSDYQPFLKANVSPDVKNAAMKKLFFSDPHFNTMDGLDTYIEDYNATHRPLPLSIIKKLASSKALSLFDTDPDEETAADAETPDSTTASPPCAASNTPALPTQASKPATPDPASRSHSTQAAADTDQPDSSPKRV